MDDSSVSFTDAGSTTEFIQRPMRW